MSLAEQYHAEHKARLTRLGAEPPISQPIAIVPAVPRRRGRPPLRTINPVPHYPRMWFWELISMPPKPNTGYTPPLQKIMDAVSRKYDVSIHDMKAARRTKKPTHARQVVMFLARKLTVMTLPQIGRYLGNRDHTTILHGVRVIEAKMGISPELRRDIDALRELLR